MGGKVCTSSFALSRFPLITNELKQEGLKGWWEDGMEVRRGQNGAREGGGRGWADLAWEWEGSASLTLPIT